MIDGVEECLQVAIHDVTLSASGEGFGVHLSDGMMRAPVGSKPVGAVAEDGLVLRRECLGDGLLDQAIQHRRDAKGAVFPFAFWDLHPPDW